MSDIYNIGIKGLLAFQQAISVTGQNIANVKTAYYSRREVNFAEDLFGSGVSVADVARIYDATASQFLQASHSSFQLNSIYYDQISELESLLGNSPKDENKTTIGVFLDATLKSLRDLDGDTSSLQARSTYLSKLTALSNRFNTISNEISQRQNNINQSLNTTVGEVNQITEQLANLNTQISAAQNLGQDVSALLDLREIQLQKLSEYLDFSTQTDTSGNVNVMLSNGSQLVFGGNTSKLSTTVNPADPNNLLLQLTDGVYTTDVTQLIGGGQIAGLYQIQSSLQSAQATLGQLSLGIMGAFNAQNALGIDYNGNLGADIFNDINSSSAVIQRAITNDNNTGNANLTVNISDITALQASDYKLVFDSPTHYTLTRLSDNSVVSSGTLSTLPQQVSADGFTINLNSGTIAAGDQFTISPTRGAASDMAMAITDPRMLALGWPVNATASTSNLGTGAINVDSIIDTTNPAFSNPGQLNPPILIQFLSPTSYQIINASTNSVIEGPITYNPANGANSIFPTPGNYDPGYRVSLSGPIQTGDTFNLNYNSNAVGDNRNGKAMENIYETGVLNGGSLTFAQGYNAFAGDIASQVSSARTGYVSSQAVLAQASSQYAQISGVSIQEESSNLAMYQECYQACAQILQAAKTVFDTIIGLGRG